MSQQAKHLYEFGPFRLDPAERLLLRDDVPLPLTNKAFDTLLVLVQHSGHMVNKDDLMRTVWPDTVVEESTLAQNVFRLRRVLGEDSGEQQYIETVPKHGYRFIAPVKEVHSDVAAALVVEKHTRSQIVTEEEEQAITESEVEELVAPQALARSGEKKRRWLKPVPLLLALLMLVVGAAALLLSRTARSGQTGTATPIKSIAVLPFKSLSSGAGDDYLGLGMADTLIIRLSSIKPLIVRPTSAVRKYSGSDQDPLVAGRQQRVDAVLDGSIHKAEGRIRVTARLMRVEDGSSLWAGTFDEKYEDIFRLQDAIVERLAPALTSKLTGDEQKLLTKHYTENTQAYLFYLKGRYHLERRTPQEVEKSINYFQQAIDIDPKYALAFAGLAESYLSRSVLGEVPAKEVMTKAKTAVEQALSIDDQLAEAYTSLGLIRTIYDWDWAGAEEAHKRALELNPNSATAHRSYGHLLRVTGRFDEALAEFNQSVALEPLSLVVNRDLGAALYFARRYDQSIEQLQKTVDLDPNFVTAYGFLERAYEAKGLYKQAVESDLKTLSVNGDSPEKVIALRESFATSGWKGYWLKKLDQTKEQAKRSYVEPYQMVRLYVRLGENDRAFEWLEKSYQERSFWLTFIKIDPLLDGLRSDARFSDLLQRVGLA